MSRPVNVDITLPRLPFAVDVLVGAALGIYVSKLFPEGKPIEEQPTYRRIRVAVPDGAGVGHTLKSGPLHLLASDGRLQLTVPAAWAGFVRAAGHQPTVRGNEARVDLPERWSPVKVTVGGYTIAFEPAR
jgi:hypothetical protein